MFKLQWKLKTMWCVFSTKLEEVYDKYSAHDSQIFLWDFNAKVGREGNFGPTTVQPLRQRYL